MKKYPSRTPGWAGSNLWTRVRIEWILRHRDPIGLALRQAGGGLAVGVALGQRVLAPNPPPLADVQMMRPIAMIDEFILGKTPAQCLVANRRRHVGIVPEQPQHSLVVVPISLEDFGSLRSVRLPASSNSPRPGRAIRWARPCRDGMVAVGFEISPRHRIELDRLIEPRDLARGDIGQQCPIVFAVVAGRFFDRRAVRPVLGQMEAKAKGLDAVVGLAASSRAADCDRQSASRFCRRAARRTFCRLSRPTR